MEYIIQFEGLKIGKHEFVFHPDQTFFVNRGFDDFRNPKVEVNVLLIKDINMLVFEIQHQGTAEVDCDRCLETYLQPLHDKNRLIVNFGEEFNDEDETVIILPRSESELDLAPYIYEYITLSLPWKKECSQDISGTKACNAEMLKKIELLQTRKSIPSEEDPRWDALKKLKNK